MALNVYLTVFKKYSSSKLQRLEIPYVIACYGIPLIPSIVFLFIRKTDRGNLYPMYGSATLWCWISDQWQIVRLASFYGPVWVVLFFTFTIYVLAGKVIFKLRDSLRGFAKESSTEGTTTTGTYPTPVPMGSIHSPTGGGEFGTMKLPTTVSQLPLKSGGSPTGPGFSGGPGSVASQSTYVPILSDPSPVAGANHHHHHQHHHHNHTHSHGQAQGHYQGNTGYTCTVESTGRPISGGLAVNNSNSVAAQRNRIAMEANTAAWAYCRCAMLFFLALVITWLPSSVNRIYTVIYPGSTNFALHFASALVLPCQGLWNGLIYIVTTLPACKKFFYQIDDKIRMLLGKKPINRRKKGKNSHRTNGHSLSNRDMKGGSGVDDMERNNTGDGGETGVRQQRGISLGLNSEGSSMESISR